MNYLDTFTFESIEEFCEMLDDVLTDSTETISVVAKYNDAKEIIRTIQNPGDKVRTVREKYGL